jgi:hypothetical protein
VLADLDIELTQSFLAHPGQRAGFVALAGLLGGFLFIRTSARMIRAEVPWWPGNVETGGGLHIHHLVWGIVTLMVSGFLSFALDPGAPWREILAGLFGFGCGLALDEFALWLHLDDVYWSREGRASVDAVIVAVTLGALVTLGIAPFDTGDGDSIAFIAALMALDMALVFVAIAKGKRFAALVGVFVPLVALIAAVRLARPRSRWARRRYGIGKDRRALRRDARLRLFRDRAFDALAGAPTTQ